MFTYSLPQTLKSRGKRLYRKNFSLGRLPRGVKGEQARVGSNVEDDAVGRFDPVNSAQENLPKRFDIRQFLETDRISPTKAQETGIGKPGEPKVSARDLGPLRCLPGTTENLRSPAGVFQKVEHFEGHRQQ